MKNKLINSLIISSTLISNSTYSIPNKIDFDFKIPIRENYHLELDINSLSNIDKVLVYLNRINHLRNKKKVDFFSNDDCSKIHYNDFEMKINESLISDIAKLDGDKNNVSYYEALIVYRIEEKKKLEECILKSVKKNG